MRSQRRGDCRQAKREGRARAQAVARNLDRAAVQLDDAPRQREPDAKTASFALRPLMRLKEQLEHACCRLGIHAYAVVAYRQLGRVRERRDAHRDAPPGRRVLHGIRHEIGHDLLDARAVGVHPDALAVEVTCRPAVVPAAPSVLSAKETVACRSIG